MLAMCGVWGVSLADTPRVLSSCWWLTSANSSDCPKSLIWLVNAHHSLVKYFECRSYYYCQRRGLQMSRSLPKSYLRSRLSQVWLFSQLGWSCLSLQRVLVLEGGVPGRLGCRPAALEVCVVSILDEIRDSLRCCSSPFASLPL